MNKVNAASMREDAEFLRELSASLPRRSKVALCAVADRLDRAAENKVKRREHARRLNKELRNGAPAR